MLLLQPNRLVQAHDLIDALWRDDPPRTAQNVLQAHVGTLRRALRPSGEAGEPEARTAEEALTLGRARDTLRRLRAAGRARGTRCRGVRGGGRGRRARGAGQSGRGSRVSCDGRSRRWRGAVDAGGAESSAAAGAVARLDELRLGAWEILSELDLRLGGPRDVVADWSRLSGSIRSGNDSTPS